MILAGIDEAGYGPLLGPLVVGASAFRFSAPAASASSSPDTLPNLWQLLSSVVSPTRDRSGRKLHIADSKLVHSGAHGLAALEKGVLAFAAASNLTPTSLDDLISAVDPSAPAHLAAHPWYPSPVPPATPEPFPLSISPALLATTINPLRLALTQTSLQPLPLHARILPEAHYNHLVSKTRNKSSVLFSSVASLLHTLMESFAHEPGGLHITCDRQGGREHYVAPLQSMFPDWHISILLETPSHARYELTRGPARTIIEFREKGESASLPTALASMLCKYLRESLMSRFNRYWQSHLPTLTPTAGYYTDGMRFLSDIAPLRTTLNIPDTLLIRER